MSSNAVSSSPSLSMGSLARRSVRLEHATLGWNAIEAAVAVASGVLAGSVALVAFGLDSAIELVSAAVVLLRLRAVLAAGSLEDAKAQRALRIIAVSFYALAAYLTITGVVALVRFDHPADSPAGIAVSAAALVVMPLLALSKRRAAANFDAVGAATPAALLRADAAETALCALLSLTTLVGVVGDAALGWSWADPVVSLTVVFFALREGREAWTGDCHAYEGHVHFERGRGEQQPRSPG